MCGVPGLSKCATLCNDKRSEDRSSPNTSGLVGEFEFCTRLLELAASDDLQGFKKVVEENNSEMHLPASWYCRQYISKKMTWCKRTPAMIACLYGSLEVLKYILKSKSCGDINQSFGADGATALHCAVAGGCACVVDVVKLLLNYGADPSIKDAQGLRPVDVVMVSQKLPLVRNTLERLLVSSRDSSSMHSVGVYVNPDCDLPSSITDDPGDLLGLEAGDGVYDPRLSISPTSLSSSLGSSSSLFSSCSASSPKSLATCLKEFNESTEKSRGYPPDPSLPDIKNSVFTSDEFRMFSFKIRPCSRAYSHDWTECPFVHPGENARRRDPRRYHYSCVPCPDFRKGSCSRGDACEYAHGVFESWLHPAQYRTRLCKDGTSCARRVCFFAHTKEELRPLYVSTGSALSSPKALSSLDVTFMNLGLGPASPSSMVMMSPFSPLQAPHTGLSTPPMSPSSAKSLAGSWSQQSIPALHLPSGTNQASRLRSSLNARDILLDELSRQSDFEGQLMSEITSLSTQARLNAALAASVCGSPTSAKVTKYRNINVAPTNLEDLFASEVVLSPRSPSHAILQSQCNSRLQSPQSIQPCSQLQTEMHSSGQAFSPICTPRHINSSTTLMPAQVSSPFKLSSPNQTGTMDSKALSKQVDVALLVPTAQRENRKCLERDACMSDWGSPTGKPEWGVHGDDLSKLRNAVSFKTKVAEEPDLSWVQKLVRDGPLDNDSPQSGCSVDVTCNSRDVVDSVLGSWMEQVQLNEIVA